MKSKNESKQTTQSKPHQLAPDLQRVLDEIGPEQYAIATAREFAVGRFRRNKRPRYAKM